MSLKKNVLLVIGVNIIVLLSSVFNSVVLPYFFTLEEYADFRTYFLYASFIGFLHFGFVDGVNIKYGGKSREDIKKSAMQSYFSFLFSFQIIFVILLLFISLLISDKFILLVSLSVLPINLSSFILFYYQAIGEFKNYSRVSLFMPFTVVILSTLLILLNVKTFEYYVLVMILGYVFSLIYIFKKENLKIKLLFKLSEYKETFLKYKSIFLSGFYIMIGNVMFALFFDSGRWITKFFLSKDLFAIYSFSVSLLGIILIFISALNKTFYPYLSKNNNVDTVNRMKDVFYVLGSLCLPLYFILHLVVQNYMPKYNASLSVSSILFTSIPGILIIKSIYVNMYKVEKTEKLFMLHTAGYLFIAFLLSLLSFAWFGTVEVVAIGTVVSIYIWALFPNFTFNTSVLKEILFLVIVNFVFFQINFMEFNYIYKFLLSFAVISLVSYAFFQRNIKNLIRL